MQSVNASKIKIAIRSAVLLAAFGLAPSLMAATVYNCNDESLQSAAASDMRCVIKLEEGQVGDRVKVLDEKARQVAEGHIVRRQGSYAIIAVADVSKTIRKGFPVIVVFKNKSSDMHWTASLFE